MKMLTKFLALCIVAGAVCFTAAPVQAAQYFAARYSFKNNGELAQPLVLDFKELGKKRIEAKVTELNTTKKILMLACSLGDDVFMTTLNDGYEYALYKIQFRPHDKEDLLILSYGPHGTGKTALKGITVIGEDAGPSIKKLPLFGFAETQVFNSPLQIRNKQAVLFRDKGAEMVTLEYDKNAQGYTVRGTN